MRRFVTALGRAVCCTLLLTSSLRAADYYVDGTNGQDSPGRGSQIQPWRTINYALDHINGSAAAPHRVLVAAGSYEENIVMDDYESVYGSYDPATWTQSSGTLTTIVNGADNGSVMVLGESSTIDRFELQKGYRDYGAGAYCRGVRATISNCRITDCESVTAGAAIHIEASTVTLLNNLIDNNYGFNSAVSIDGSVVQSTGNVVRDNLQSHSPYVNELQGIGFYIVNNSVANLINDRIIRNGLAGVSVGRDCRLSARLSIFGNNGHVTSAFGGIFAGGTNVELTDCVISENGAPVRGGGVVSERGDFTAIRCVFCQNTGYYYGGALHASPSSYAGDTRLIDCIVVSNFGGWQSMSKRWDHGAWFNRGRTVLTNNLIVGNGRLVFNNLSNGGRPISTNNAVADNQGGYRIESIWSHMINVIYMRNDILWGNGDDFEVLGGLASEPNLLAQDISYCNIEDGDLNGVKNTISVNPDFLGEVGAGTIDALAYDVLNCRSVVSHAGADWRPNAFARCILWTNNTAFYIESNTSDQITVYGNVLLAAFLFDSFIVKDYHLHPLSLCLNVGTNEGAPDHDFEGDARPMNGITEMGADESPGPQPTRCGPRWTLY